MTYDLRGDSKTDEVYRDVIETLNDDFSPGKLGRKLGYSVYTATNMAFNEWKEEATLDSPVGRDVQNELNGSPFLRVIDDGRDSGGRVIIGSSPENSVSQVHKYIKENEVYNPPEELLNGLEAYQVQL